MRHDALANNLLRWLTLKTWLGLVAVLVVLLGFKFYQGVVIETDILALLPLTEQDPVIELASQTFNDALTKRHLILVGAKKLEHAVTATEKIASQLDSLKPWLRWEYQFEADKQQQILSPYLDFQYQLLDNNTRKTLAQGGEGFLRSTLQMMYSPLTPLSSALLENDPLLLFYRFANSLTKGLENISLVDGMLVAHHDGRHYVLLNVVLKDSPFSLTLQENLVAPLDKIIADVSEQHPAVEVLNVGVVRYAHESVSSAQQEVTTIGFGSIAGVVIILLLVFRSSVPILASLLAIAMGFLAAFTACQWLFGSVHLLTLVFGASLVGISIDYSFHYFSDRLAGGKEWTASNGVGRIFPGISLGLLTSVLGYIGLCFTPFPGMQQIAIFSTVGLSAAFITVACVFPYLGGKAGSSLVGGRWLQLTSQFTHYLAWPRSRVILLLLLLVVGSLLGIQKLSVDDDIRLLQNASPLLKAEEVRAMSVLGRGLSNQFLVIEGDSAEQLLQREELLRVDLRQLQAEGSLVRFEALSQHLPSALKQKNNVALVQEHLLTNTQPLLAYAQSLGLSAAVTNDFINRYSHEPTTFLSLENWLATPAADSRRHLWLGQTQRGVASVITLYGGTADALEALDKAWNQVTLVDKVTDISRLLKDYRERTAVLVILSYLLIYGLLCYRYGVRRAFTIMLPPLMAVLVVLGVLGWIGQALNIFHLLALLLVLGIGIDYTLFLEEGRQHRSSTMLAIILSALTTLLSFGLLALSATPAVEAFGLTILLGIGVCLLLAPMLCGREQ